jgi:hypothetical protein
MPEFTMQQPNIVFVFADQWRGQATGYASDPNVRTPNLDRLAEESINLVNAVSNCPLCTPYRASLLTGQYPLTHGLFVNDVPLDPNAVSLGKIFASHGYDTAYIGKWHVDGHGRDAYIPPERRQGFQHWKVLECTHDYNRSAYYADDSPEPLYWEGYDAIGQTRAAQRYIREHDGRNPFLLVVSWGPPHNPYGTAPEAFRRLYEADRLRQPPNVPLPMRMFAHHALAGYYAHCSALDACVGDLLRTLEEQGLADDTIGRLPRTRQQTGAVGRIHPGAVPVALPGPVRPRSSHGRLSARRAGHHAHAARPVRTADPEHCGGAGLLRPSPRRFRSLGRRGADRLLPPHRRLVAWSGRPGVPGAAHQAPHLRPLAGRAVDALR